MIVYEGLKSEFVSDVFTDVIEYKIDESFFQKLGYHTGAAEQNAWKNSMQYMYKVLATSTIPDNAGVAIEFRIPNTSKRVDFILSGKDENQKNTAVIVELKQWESAEIVSGKDAIVSTFVGQSIHEVAHPSYQAWSYATTIEQYNQTVQDKSIELHPCAYLHNYKSVNPPTLLSPTYRDYLEKAPAFIEGDIAKLQSFIQKYIKFGDNKETLYEIDNGKIRPSKALQDTLTSLLKGNQEFIMIDDQKVVYETAIQWAKKSKLDGKKRVMIVQGGPGTGKSVVAVNLLVQLTKEGLLAQYVTKNSAPRNVYSAKLKGTLKKTTIDNLFKGSGCFVDCEPDLFDALIVDEAHRLNAKSGMFKNQGENQVKEIINASKFSIFFIDENQKIDIYDIGTISEIEKYAGIAVADKQNDIAKLELTSQFRCNGSDGYISWVDDVLGIRQTGNADGFDLDYDIQICDNPNDVMNKIKIKNQGRNKSRVLAGYCWDWKSKNNFDGDVFDIEFPEFDFRKKWNFANSTTYAIDPSSINEIGCIHTSQGLEFDYVGVIIGKDLQYRDNKIQTFYTERAHTDNSLKGIKAMAKADREAAETLADTLIKNTYKTLLTRGQKGCYIYCVDAELREYLKNRLIAAGRTPFKQDVKVDLPVSVKLELENVDWSTKDVMVGVLRNPEQLGICLANNFYHIPVKQLSPEMAANITHIALYQSANNFGSNSGIRYFGEVESAGIVKRNAINEIPKDSTEPYYLFKIKEWQELPFMMKSNGNIPRVTFFTNLFLLKNCNDTKALSISSKEEYLKYYEDNDVYFQ